MRIVIKLGTSTLTHSTGNLNIRRVEELCRVCSDLKNAGHEIVLVSSGAIAMGVGKLSLAHRPTDIPTKQAAAAVGQCELMYIYDKLFSQYHHVVAQILITAEDIASPSLAGNFHNTLFRLLELGTLPIINENDTVATAEMGIGDNDTLGAIVAKNIGADLLVLLSDIDGLYTADPRKDAGAELLEQVGKLSEEIEASAGGVGSASGSGGMLTKVAAARVLMSAGIPMVICEGHRKNAVTDACHGRSVGTRFFDNDSLGMHARKSWIALGGKVRGRVTCDLGAVRALSERGASLLPVGVTAVEGSFAAGDPVDLVDEQGRLLGRGLAGYDSSKLRACIGKRGMDEFINRDQLVLF